MNEFGGDIRKYNTLKYAYLVIQNNQSISQEEEEIYKRL